jgi:gp16 family phage-associated protein
MQEGVKVSTHEDVLAEFRRRGVSVSAWARRHGVSPQLTYQILSGRKVGLRGQSHQICVLLGLKPGVVAGTDDLQFVHSPDPGAHPLNQQEGRRQAQPA